MFYAIKNMKPMFLQYRIITPKGKQKWVEVNSYPQKQKDNTVIWYGFHQDITVNKKLEIENRLNEEKIKFIVENTETAMIMIENNKVSFISSNYKNIFGYSIEEETTRINNYAWDLIADEDTRKKEVIEKLKNAVRKQQKSISIKYKFQLKNGELIWRSDEIIFFYDKNGKVNKVVELASNITEKTGLEDLILNQNMQLALQIEENERISENFVTFQNSKWLEIAESLHDNISQLLFAANLHLSNNTTESNERANKILALAINEVKYITQGTKNLLIQDKGLDGSLNEFIENNNLLNNIEISKNVNPDFYKRFSSSENIILFALIQETVQNAIKHSKGTKIKITLDILNENYIVSIKDNGVGLADTYINGMGIYNVSKNVTLLNGNIAYVNKNGLEVIVKIK